jgi:signal transduction histidine kinase
MTLQVGEFEETEEEGADPVERAIQIAFAVALVLLGITGIVSYLSVIRLTDDAQWVAHTGEIIANLEALLSRTTDVETAVRGYAITGEDSYLEPYQSGTKEGIAILSRLKQLTADNALQQRRLEMLSPIFAERLTAALAVIDARKSQGFEGAQRMVLSGKEKALHDRIREIVREMTAAERKLLNPRQDRTKRATKVTQLVIVSGCAIAIICVGFAPFFIRWQLVRRTRLLATLRHQVSLLAQSQEQLRERARVLDLKTVELQESARDLARSNRDLQQFAYVASHDLQEPLRMVVNFTQLLAKRYQDKLDKDAHDFIEYAVDGATRMQTLISDLLNYSRVGMQGKPFKLTNCEAILEQVLVNLKFAIVDSGAVITHDSLPMIMGDDTHLSQLFQNLLGNAIKFRGENSPRVHVSSERNGNDWKISVQDNGIGISPEHRERIFLIFQRLHTKAEYPGTGIGLAVCKKIVERHGGRIWIESPTEGGSIFSFTIPIPS